MCPQCVSFTENVLVETDRDLLCLNVLKVSDNDAWLEINCVKHISPPFIIQQCQCKTKS